MIEALINRIKIRQSEIAIALSIGSAASWESYQRMVGENFGLQAAMDMIDTMLEEDKNKE